jgi:hypothetical protein
MEQKLSDSIKEKSTQKRVYQKKVHSWKKFTKLSDAREICENFQR